MTSTKFDTKPMAMVWEPLSQPGLSKKVVEALEEICGEGDVAHHVMSHQHDGWSCGYIAGWWSLYQHTIIESGGACMERPPKPPVGWNEA